MKLKEIITELIKDKLNHFSLRELVGALSFLLLTAMTIGMQFYQFNVSDLVYSSLCGVVISCIAGYSYERS
jgi:uncharacterized membrane protein YoaK (UPF0700 family)